LPVPVGLCIRVLSWVEVNIKNMAANYSGLGTRVISAATADIYYANSMNAALSVSTAFALQYSS
jgi:hypothetical protein